VAGEVRIGTSGWVYPHWRETFYPKGLPQSRWLEHYAERFNTVELNNPFYRQPERATFERWRRAVPDDFVYAVKLNRFLTHLKRLNVDRAMVARSYDTMAGLGPKAAVVLVQLPARFRFDADRVARFFAAVAPVEGATRSSRATRVGSRTRRSPFCANEALPYASATRRSGRRAGR